MVVAPIDPLRPVRLADARLARVVAPLRLYLAHHPAHAAESLGCHIQPRFDQQVEARDALPIERDAVAPHAPVPELHHKPGPALRALRLGYVRAPQGDQRHQPYDICEFPINAFHAGLRHDTELSHKYHLLEIIKITSGDFDDFSK